MPQKIKKNVFEDEYLIFKDPNGKAHIPVQTCETCPTFHLPSFQMAYFEAKHHTIVVGT